MRICLEEQKFLRIFMVSGCQSGKTVKLKNKGYEKVE